MELPPPQLYQLIKECAPMVHPLTMGSIVRQESGGKPYVINFPNPKYKLAHQPRTREQAIATAKMLDSKGYKFASGLGQIYSTNVKKFNWSWEQIFDPCTNLRFSSRILAQAFIDCKPRGQDDQAAIGCALSVYYSGNRKTGFDHGYVASVKAHAKKSLQRMASIDSQNAKN